MVRKRLVDHNALVQAIAMGLSKQEVMQQFGYRSLGALKVAYLDALMALSKVPAINNKRTEKKVDNVVGINSRGSLVIPKKLVDALGLDKTVLFQVVKEGAGLSLKAKKRLPKTILRKKNR